MSAHVLRSSFNAGEISPLMDYRVDSEKYGFGCRRLENLIPRVYGGAFRRSGTVYVGQAEDETNEVRLLPFNFSGSTTFIIELGDEYMRFWSDGALVEDSGGSVISLTTPWPASRVFDVQMVQLNDVCYFTNGFHRPQKLTRFADDDWRIEDMPLSFPALADDNLTGITARVYNSGGQDYFEFDSGTYTEADDYPLLFDVSYRTALDPNNFGTSDWVGTYLQVVHRRDSSSESLDLSVSGTTTTSDLRVVGDYEIFTYGNWAGTLTLERKDSTGAYETLRDFEGEEDRNIQYQGTADVEETLRLSYTYTSNTGATRAILEAADSRVYGLVQVTERTAINQCKVNIINQPLDDTYTDNWAMEAWNGVWGFPSAIAFHEQRLIFGGTKRAPTTFWGSTSGDFENFKRSTLDDASFAFTLAAQEGSAIQSMLSHQHLLLFTETEEWSVSTNEKTVLTPTNPYVRRHSRYGSDNRQAIVAGQGILFLERGARKLRQYSYSEFESTSVATDLTLLAEHITGTGVKQIAFQSDPDPIVWCILDDGDLVSLTLETQQNVIAWAKHTTTGNFESVAVIYGDGTNGDEVWFVVKRMIGGSTRRYIERFDPEVTTKIDAGQFDRLVFADAAVVATRDPSTSTVSGLGHLNGETVSILADGNVLPDQEVISGSVSLDRSAGDVVVGLPYTSLLQPSRVEFGLDTGTAQGRTFRMSRATVNLYQSLGIEYADDPEATEADWTELVDGDATNLLEEEQSMLTGEYDLVNLGKHAKQIGFCLRQKKPLPCNILGLVMKANVAGD